MFGESKEENLKSAHKRIFKLGDTTLEEVKSVKHAGVELSAFSSSEHMIQTVCNKSHNIIASLSTAGLRPKRVAPNGVRRIVEQAWHISSTWIRSMVWDNQDKHIETRESSNTGT